LAADDCKKGNFYLPFSQQPGPLVSLGQNLLEKIRFKSFFLPINLKEEVKALSMLSLASFMESQMIFLSFSTLP
jgi:hypothetical protein